MALEAAMNSGFLRLEGGRWCKDSYTLRAAGCHLVDREWGGVQAKYMVLRVSWWICTALANAWGSLPLLCPEMWLPSALWG